MYFQLRDTGFHAKKFRPSKKYRVLSEEIFFQVKRYNVEYPKFYLSKKYRVLFKENSFVILEF